MRIIISRRYDLIVNFDTARFCESLASPAHFLIELIPSNQTKPSSAYRTDNIKFSFMYLEYIYIILATENKSFVDKNK